MKNTIFCCSRTGRHTGRRSPNCGLPPVCGGTVMNGRERPVNTVNARNTAPPFMNAVALMNSVDGGDRHHGTAVEAAVVDQAGVDQGRGERSRSAQLVVLACRADRHVTDREAAGEATGRQGVLPDGSLPSPPRLDLDKDESGIPGRRYRQVPVTPRNPGVSGQRTGSLPDTGRGDVHDD